MGKVKGKVEGKVEKRIQITPSNCKKGNVKKKIQVGGVGFH